jgi:hypothetical protein
LTATPSPNLEKVAGFAPATVRNGMCDSTNSKSLQFGSLPTARRKSRGGTNRDYDAAQPTCQKQKWECTDGGCYPCIPISILDKVIWKKVSTQREFSN